MFLLTSKREDQKRCQEAMDSLNKAYAELVRDFPNLDKFERFDEVDSALGRESHMNSWLSTRVIRSRNKLYFTIENTRSAYASGHHYDFIGKCVDGALSNIADIRDIFQHFVCAADFDILVAKRSQASSTKP